VDPAAHREAHSHAPLVQVCGRVGGGEARGGPGGGGRGAQLADRGGGGVADLLGCPWCSGHHGRGASCSLGGVVSSCGLTGVGPMAGAGQRGLTMVTPAEELVASSGLPGTGAHKSAGRGHRRTHEAAVEPVPSVWSASHRRQRWVGGSAADIDRSPTRPPAALRGRHRDQGAAARAATPYSGRSIVALTSWRG
jgi:hypothetical protein